MPFPGFAAFVIIDVLLAQNDARNTMPFYCTIRDSAV